MPAILFVDLSRMSSPPAKPGLVPCAVCGKSVHPDKPTIHFPNASTWRPCVASWPVTPTKKAAAA